MANTQTISASAIVLGAGPAGISCALELHENKIDVCLLDQHTRLAQAVADISNRIRNFAGRVWPNGAALRESLEEQTATLGLKPMLVDRIAAVDLKKMILHGDNCTYRAKAIFLATGARVRRLDIPGLKAVEAHVSYSVEPIEEELKGKVVAVVGGGDNAMMDASWLAERCPQVFLIHRSPLRGRPDVIALAHEQKNMTMLASSAVASISKAKEMAMVLSVHNHESGQYREIPVDYLIVKVGYAPNTELFNGQLSMSDKGHVIIDEHCATSLPGVFAGGDAAHPESLGIARAVGHGLVAARAMAGFIHSRD